MLGSVAAQLQGVLRQFFSNFVKARYTEVLAFQQIVTRATEQFANRSDAESHHAFAGANGKVQVGNRSLK